MEKMKFVALGVLGVVPSSSSPRAEQEGSDGRSRNSLLGLPKAEPPPDFGLWVPS